MARIRVVTDSACDLAADVAAEHGVAIVPLTIRFGSEEFVDGRDLSTDEFWSRCKASDLLPEAHERNSPLMALIMSLLGFLLIFIVTGLLNI